MSGLKHWPWIVVMLVCLCLGNSWTAVASSDVPHTASGHVHASGSDLPAGEFTAGSLYQLPTVWTTATEQPLRLGDLQGKVQVLAMLYTSCEYACPILLSILQNIAVALTPAVREQVGFVLVTFDPEHDTPAVLRSYGAKMALDPAHWTLLHGDADDTLELAVLLGVKYRKEPQGGFAHSNLITVLNRQGEIVHRHIGLQQSIADTLAIIQRLAHE